MPISASAPVTVAGTSSIDYNEWFMTQLIIKANADKAFTIVHLNRSATIDGKTVLMPSSEDKSEISFTLDIFKEMTNTPELATAMGVVLAAVQAYAAKKNLL